MHPYEVKCRVAVTSFLPSSNKRIFLRRYTGPSDEDRCRAVSEEQLQRLRLACRADVVLDEVRGLLADGITGRGLTPRNTSVSPTDGRAGL